MFSYDVVVRTGNHHNLFDLNENKNLTACKQHTIRIADHIWLGHNANIFSGADIGNGCVIGANAFINQQFPCNCSIAGNPAKILNRNIAWRRENYPYYEDYKDFEEYDYRDD